MYFHSDDRPSKKDYVLLSAALCMFLASKTHAQEKPLVAVTLPSVRTPIRVAADPDNMPFSNQHLQGFENELAAWLGKTLNRDIEYVWHSSGRGFVTETLLRDRADVIMAVPSKTRSCLITLPYYRSAYMFISKPLDPPLHSLGDKRLHKMSIGMPWIGVDHLVPPAEVLVRKGLRANLVPIRLMNVESGNYSYPSIARSVTNGKTDIGLVWGPIASYLAPRYKLQATPITEDESCEGIPMSFEISIGVRRDMPELREAINQALLKQQPEVLKILHRAGISPIKGDESEGRKS